MRYISFHELYTLPFEISDVCCMSQQWVNGALFRRDKPRLATGILWLQSARGIYTSHDGRKLEVTPKNLVCLPVDSVYTVLNLDCAPTPIHAYLVEFNIKVGESIVSFADMPFMINSVNKFIAAELTRAAVKAYEAPVQSPVAIRAAVYRLLEFLGRETLVAYKRKFESISRGIELMEDDRQCRLTIEEIAAESGVSSGCFRRLFREYSGKSPLDYRMDLRLSLAKNMLAESDQTVESIADALGFDSGAYFCRLFKKKTDLTPSEFRAKIKDEGI